MVEIWIFAVVNRPVPIKARIPKRWCQRRHESLKCTYRPRDRAHPQRKETDVSRHCRKCQKPPATVWFEGMQGRARTKHWMMDKCHRASPWHYTTIQRLDQGQFGSKHILLPGSGPELEPDTQKGPVTLRNVESWQKPHLRGDVPD